ncbi:MAG: 23S rRNA (guanosine(2251)-2'-O)-methyltransferase RlmB [Gammaproteobacteria bacterium]|nr:MAG: 23S rRNA (guanosine(2251)-2'-O)-methyltransferase RlmB [Gammaproteobacteria bacterium]
MGEGGPRGQAGERARGQAGGEGLALAAGPHAVEALLRRRPREVRQLLLAEAAARGERGRRLRGLAEAAGVPVALLPRRELDARAPGLRHQGVLALHRPARPWDEGRLAALLEGLAGEAPPLLLVLDGVQDPRNLGACLRSAEAAGAHAVVVPKDRAAGLTPAARKAAAGAAELVPLVQVTNLARSLRALQERGLWLVGLEAGAPRRLFELDLRGPLALVLGAEGRGLRRLTRERCDFLAALPMRGAVGSLNVAVAAGVALYEALRQREA